MRATYLLMVLAACGGGDDGMTMTDTSPIRIGQAAATSGTNQQLGTATKLGIEAAFAEQNAAGGIPGRQLQLEFRDDQYDPSTAVSAARELVDAQAMTAAPNCPSTATPPTGFTATSTTALERGPNAVLAMLGSVGTPTSVPEAAVAIETGTLFIGASTGTNALLRDNAAGECSRFIFNIRASYAQEARATLELFQTKGITAATNIISFDQNDSFGDSGYNGLVAGYADLYGGTAPTITRFRYARNDDASVPAQAVAMETYLAQLLQTQSGNISVGIFMTDTYGAATNLIQHVRDWQYASDTQQTQLMKATRLRIYFSNVSFVNADALSDRLVSLGTVTTPSGPSPYTTDVYVSQVVPNLDQDISEVVGSFKQQVLSSKQTFLALEGYITAKVLIAGLLAHQGELTPASLAATLEAQASLPVGLVGPYGFSATNHQYSSTVWGIAVQADGSYQNLYSWRAGQGIELAY
jgi:ABC-type branched-subunit amino acid transport system substrate-binding protein